jgi:biofilm PGA synthesis N-glycosyltransferase PgaC
MWQNTLLYDIVEQLIGYSYYYPLLMAYLWMAGSIFYYFHWERKTSVQNPPKLPSHPLVSVLVPCHNEELHIQETIDYLMLSKYPNFEVIAINDGSSDKTGEILKSLQQKYDRLRVIELAENHGKATALNMGALAANGEYLVCIDGDAILDDDAIHWMMYHFLTGARVGAVTGNPRIRNRSSLLGKIQIGEFSAIVGMIKRAQRVYGRVFTVSGVVAAFRKSAVHKVGYWHTDMATEDIDISWRLELNHWDIRFEPNALCWMLVPETLSGLWKQRLRWAQGGAEVIRKYFRDMFDWKSRRMWGIYLEYLLSLVWAYAAIMTLGLWALGYFVDLPPQIEIPTLIPSIYGTILGVTFLLQFGLSLFIDSKYEKGIARYYYWIIWYPFVFWIINVFTTSVGFLKAMFKKKGKKAIWESPDRGWRA